MLKEVYPVGSVVVVTTTHRVLPCGPYTGKGTKVTIDGSERSPYGIWHYEGHTETGESVIVRDIHVELVLRPMSFPEGSLVFVTKTHSAKEGTYLKVYAGDHLTVTEFSKGFDGVPAHYWGLDAAGDYRALLADKIALVESEPEKLTPPVAPKYVAKHGEILYHESGTKYEGYWKYNTYWGWSNFVASNPELYREPKIDEDMTVNGVLAVK